MGKTAVATGEAFARSPTFMIDGEEVTNPCIEALPAADCVVDFLKRQGVEKVVAKNIGPNSLRLLRENGISAGDNPGSDKSSFEVFLENKFKFIGFTAFVIGVAWAGHRVYKRFKKE